MKILNLYGGIGGNRYLWGNDHKITMVDNNQKICDIYQKLFPGDTVICGDAHEYLLAHADEFDFIWSSPPCQSHSKMMKGTRHKIRRYVDMTLYQEIIFLKHFFKGKWIVENVKGYYEPLVKPQGLIDRHLFWGNISIPLIDLPKKKNFIKTSTKAGRYKIFEWLGIEPFEEIVYFEGSHDPCAFLRNCVHPLIGLKIMEEIK